LNIARLNPIRRHVRHVAVLPIMALVAVGISVGGPAQAEVAEVGGGAFGERVDALVSSGPLPSVTLPAKGGGPFTAAAADVHVTGLLSVQKMSVRTEGRLGADDGYAQSSAAVSRVSVAGGIVTADQLTSQCRSTSKGSSGSISAVNLRVGGARIVAQGTMSIDIPGGRVVVNEQVRSNKTGSTALTVNGLRVTLFGSGSMLNEEIVVAQSRCRAKGSDIGSSPTSSTTTSTTSTTEQPQGCAQQCTIFPASAVPGTVDGGDDGAAVELGVRFEADRPGDVLGVRFYKSRANIGRHVGNLWRADGTLLASAEFTAETESGWQQVNFAAPVPISQGERYVASYHTHAGHYSFDGGYFAFAGVENPPLHAPADDPDGQRNGVFVYSFNDSTFPSIGYGGANYWVDVVFSPT
jgi:hypothetical protein